MDIVYNALTIQWELTCLRVQYNLYSLFYDVYTEQSINTPSETEFVYQNVLICFSYTELSQYQKGHVEKCDLNNNHCKQTGCPVSKVKQKLNIDWFVEETCDVKKELMFHLRNSCCRSFPAQHVCSSWSHCARRTWSPTLCFKRERRKRNRINKQGEAVKTPQGLTCGCGRCSCLPELNVVTLGIIRFISVIHLLATIWPQLVNCSCDVSGPLVPLLSGTSLQKMIHSVHRLELEHQLKIARQGKLRFRFCILVPEDI